MDSGQGTQSCELVRELPHLHNFALACHSISYYHRCFDTTASPAAGSTAFTITINREPLFCSGRKLSDVCGRNPRSGGRPL
jgi:hypothetical protein